MVSINLVTVHFFFLVDNVLRTVLALFMEDEALPLPTLEEVLICNPNTTAEEVRDCPCVANHIVYIATLLCAQYHLLYTHGKHVHGDVSVHF